MALPSKQRVALIHKGNAIFNKKNYKLAEKVFRTAKYQDGLIRLGQHYYHQKKYLKSADIFRFAGYLKGEYACYVKMGLAKEVLGKDDKEFTKVDKDINKKFAQAISLMMGKDNNP